MKRTIMKNLFGNSNNWIKLKNKNYGPNIDTNKKNSIVVQDGEISIKYTKDENKIIKEVLHRFIDTDEQILTCPQTDMDKKAFNYFEKQDEINSKNIGKN